MLVLKATKEIKRASEPNLDTAGILELSDEEFKITMINMPSPLMEIVNNMQEYMANVSRDKNHKQTEETFEIKSTTTEMSVFDEFVSRLHITMESESLKIFQ
jgi:hypothetical protein